MDYVRAFHLKMYSQYIDTHIGARSSVVALTRRSGEHSSGFADNYCGSTAIPFRVVARYAAVSEMFGIGMVSLVLEFVA